MITFLIEAIVLYASKNPINDINNYPPKIIDRCKKMGLINNDQLPKSKKVIKKKLFACLVFLIIFVLIIYYINKATNFKEGFIISYGLWLVVDWYDAFILDCVWFCHDKRFIIPGTEDMKEEYLNYKFHILGSLKGMFIGIPVSLIVGIIIELL